MRHRGSWTQDGPHPINGCWGPSATCPLCLTYTSPELAPPDRPVGCAAGALPVYVSRPMSRRTP
jgi:hypothetical protein